MGRRRGVRRHPAKMVPPSKARAPQRPTASHGDDYLAGYDRARRVADGYPPRAWATFIYACAGKKPSPESKGCGWEHRVWLMIGVEGPEPHKREGNTIPAPFFCGVCPDCGGSLHHDRWAEDEFFDHPGRALPPDVAYFSVPTPAEARQSASSGYGGAQYTDPTGRTTRGRTST